MPAWKEMRRKLLLALDLLNWRRQTAMLRAEAAPTPHKTLLVGSLLSLPSTLKAEAVYARALQMRGYRPIFALAGQSSYNLAVLRTVLGDKLRIVALEDYADAADEEAVRVQAEQLLAQHPTLDSFLPLQVDGIRVGRNSLSTVVRGLRAAHVNFADAGHRALIEKALRQSLIASRRATRLVQDVRPDIALFNERGYTPAGELFDATLVQDIDAIQWVGAPQADHLLYKRYNIRNRGEHPLALSDDTWSRLLAAPWSQADETRLMQRLASHYESGAWFNRQQLHQGKTIFTPEQVRTQLRVEPGRKIAVIFSHILYDATFFFGDSLFVDYATWLIETIRVAITNPQIHWVVKVHPVNVWRSKMDNAPLEQLEARVLRQAFGELPPHITIMPADTPINTYALFQTIDYGLTVRGTAGMELPCYGIPTVTAGNGRYSGRGFTLDPATQDGYRALLARLHTLPPLDAATKALARRYAFGTFYLRPQPLTFFRMLYQAKSYGLAELQINMEVTGPGAISDAPDMQAFCDFVKSGAEDFLTDMPRG